eukprot:CAMPEP_0172713672 /NCGR_PEP_ID=MMETSP1074-20121228/63327_1 /TAXON_ID=2916 /ORGANISM="Ceratium fusus, Strain PA161109" /LENGTH=260 /DNA_ID=CAMNT_0013537847 /DNA_START=154 /DNA_END=936 /DNA_ORIENTATION=-
MVAGSGGQWVVKGTASAAASSCLKSDVEAQLYQRDLLLRAREKDLDAADAEEPAYKLGCQRPPAELDLPPVGPPEPRSRRRDRARGSSESSVTNTSSMELHADMPSFVPSWMFQPLPLDLMQRDSSSLGMPLPAATAATHFAAVEAAQRAAASARITALSNVSGKAAETKNQIEYYFSVQNVCHDQYLRSLMDDDGWVGLKEIINFPKLSALSIDVVTAAAVLSGSGTVQLSDDGTRVRISNDVIRQAFPRTPAESGKQS